MMLFYQTRRMIETIPPPQQAPFRSHLGVKAKGAVVLLGAGASAGVGAPLMRQFVDKARYLIAVGAFADHERADVEAVLTFYADLQKNLRITEEDIENVENLLSLAELGENVNVSAMKDWLRPGISAHVRRFVDLVIARSLELPAPDAAAWAHLGDKPFHKRLVAAMTYYGDKLTVVTLNYDCVLEYCCHCLGVPFTYHRKLGKGVEILKLHGSTNWLRCETPRCANNNKVRFAPLRFRAKGTQANLGYLDQEAARCEACGEPLQSIIVPPTWGKSLDHVLLRVTWSRAAQALSDAQVFSAFGYSLPLADVKVRNLLTIGFASGNLVQAMVVVGHDEHARGRWSEIFRKYWAESRLDIRMELFEGATPASLFPSLAIPEGEIGSGWFAPPLPTILLDRALQKRIVDEIGPGEIDSFIRNYRTNPASVKDDPRTQKILDLGIGEVPRAEILPSHGSGWIDLAESLLRD